MKQRTIATILILLALLPLSAAAQTVAERRPNVLLILTDDQGWGDLRVNGNEKIDTPDSLQTA